MGSAKWPLLTSLLERKRMDVGPCSACWKVPPRLLTSLPERKRMDPEQGLWCSVVVVVRPAGRASNGNRQWKTVGGWWAGGVTLRHIPASNGHRQWKTVGGRHLPAHVPRTAVAVPRIRRDTPPGAAGLSVGAGAAGKSADPGGAR